MLAVGADLKNTITLVVDGQAFVSQHIGDLDHSGALQAFSRPFATWSRMYEVAWEIFWWSTICIRNMPPPVTRASCRHAEARSPTSSGAHRFRARRERSLGRARHRSQFRGTGYGETELSGAGNSSPASIDAGFPPRHASAHGSARRAGMRLRAIRCNARLAFYRKSADCLRCPRPHFPFRAATRMLCN